MYIMPRHKLLPPIGARLESTNQDSALIMYERITVKNVQSQSSLTQSARAAMSNIVWINRVYPMCRICCVAPPINAKGLSCVVVLRLSTVAVKRLQHLIGSRVFKLTRLEVIRFRCTQCAKRF